MFGLSDAWCPVELHVYSTHWLPFTHHGQHQDCDGHQTKTGHEEPWHEVKTGESTGTSHTKRKVCPSFGRTCTPLTLSQSSSCHELPCPTLSFSLFHASKSKQRSLGSRQNTTHTTSTRVTKATIGWILTTWDFS